MQLIARRAIVLVLILAVFSPYIIFAQGAALPEKIVPCNGIDCSCQDLITLAQNIINTGIFLAVFLSAILFAYAGWLYFTNEAVGGQAKARKLFTNVAIGLIIILAAWLVVDTLVKGMLKDNVVWNNICSGLGF